MIRFLTAGESHGKAEVVIIEGIPAGLPINKDEINFELKKRSYDFGRGGRGKIEKDEVQILSGVRFGKTIGSPISLMINNLDFENWKEKMDPEDNNTDKETIKITKPRPGHADLAGAVKYGFDDIRNVLERASARETITRVAAGAIFKKLLKEFAISIASHTIQIGKIKIEKSNYSFKDIYDVFEKDPDIRCIDEKAREKIKQEITNARINKNTLGGVIEVIANNIPVGLGNHTHWDKKLDGRIAQTLMSIPSVKAVEIGNAIEAAGKTGKEIQDVLFIENQKIQRKTNNMGGIEGGISNGEDIICRVFHKPISTIYDPLPSVDIKTMEPTLATVERSDICIVPRAGVVAEAMLAFVLADSIMEKFGGDNIIETKTNFENYLLNNSKKLI